MTVDFRMKFIYFPPIFEQWLTKFGFGNPKCGAPQSCNRTIVVLVTYN